MTKISVALWRRFRRYTKTTPLVVSWQKSGRTWLRVMLDDLGISPEFTHAGADLGQASIKQLRCAVSEHRRRRILLLYRDPRDVVVSNFHHFKYRSGTYDGSLSEFIRDENLGIACVIAYNLFWLDNVSKNRGWMKLSYEDLSSNAAEQLRAVVHFLKQGKTVDNAKLEAVVAENHFSQMQKGEQSGELAKRFPDRFSEANADPLAAKVRKGKVGGFRDEMSDEDIAFCEGAIQATGYGAYLPD